ncbi:MAG: hypothetical protein H7319_01365 [Spirosoma sp.]|nr:hypothetical protein [Spirosoma sp.]
MNNLYQQQLDHILTGLHIDPVHARITLRADGVEAPYQPDTLRPTLTSLLYQYFYCATEATPATSDPTDTAFADELSRHNRAIERFDPAWTVDSIDTAGLVYATKGNDRQVLYAGEFINEQPKRGPVQPGDTLRLWQPTGQRDRQSGFYFVFGQTPDTGSVVLQTRLYFHARPAGSLLLVQWVSQTLNAYRVPFQFKCLDHPDLYGRCDSAVLYVQKPHLMLVFALLADALPALSPHLLPAVPLFTRPLVPGVAFAESPPNPNESFGTSRCSLIAEGIANAVLAGKPADAWAASVEAVFAQIGLLLQHPYRNPVLPAGSTGYPYQFPDYSLN